MSNGSGNKHGGNSRLRGDVAAAHAVRMALYFPSGDAAHVVRGEAPGIFRPVASGFVALAYAISTGLEPSCW